MLTKMYSSTQQYNLKLDFYKSSQKKPVMMGPLNSVEE